ncbi:HAD-IB family phosphatase [bacterium]|nr:HAD-IB family phosphatase [bacterium]
MTIRGILVTDFDGTMTEIDFYTIVVDRLTPAGALRHWSDFEAGSITHFEALRRIFAEMRSTPDQIEQVLRDMNLDPAAGEAIAGLRRAGWNVIVASAGCRWYIQRLFERARIDVEYHSNPGEFDADGALQMTLPQGAKYFHPDLGVDKAGIVRTALNQDVPVAFAGDGIPDLEAAMLVPAERRFARGALAGRLRARGEDFRGYAHWSEIARMLLVEARS